jgi:hypothetical protein
MDEPTITAILERERSVRLCPIALDALHDVRADRIKLNQLSNTLSV